MLVKVERRNNFGGQLYTAIPLEADGFAYNGQGSLPRPTLRVSNLFSTITALIATLPNGLEGVKVTRLRTLAKYIDWKTSSGQVMRPTLLLTTGKLDTPQTTPQQTAQQFSRKRFIFTSIASQLKNRNLIEFELASAFDLAGVRAKAAVHQPLSVGSTSRLSVVTTRRLAQARKLMV